MSDELKGKMIAVLAADGVEQVEMVEPRKAIEHAGGSSQLLSIGEEDIQAMEGDITPKGTFPVDRLVSDVSVGDYDGLILPGGTVNPDKLRADEDAVAFVKAFVESGKPVAAICHGPWTLVEAGVVEGRTLTSYPSIRTDIRNAGGDVVDEEVAVDGNLITSRSPDDLEAFGAAFVKALT